MDFPTISFTYQEENLAVSSLQSSLEQTRGHLQKQLRQKDADCNRMAVQIRVSVLYNCKDCTNKSKYIVMYCNNT